MEDVLDTYALTPDPKRPLVCFDETPYQMIAETRTPKPTTTGHPATHNYEYKRAGVANLFMICICSVPNRQIHPWRIAVATASELVWTWRRR